jgi:hypothetical protein
LSAKWVRSKQWDDQNLPSWAWPIKFLLRAFSSIPLAVVLLTLIVIYSTLASVPVGLMALGVTYFIYFLTILLAIGIVAVIPTLVVRRLWKPTPANRTSRFVTSLVIAVLLSGLAVELWVLLAWPRLHYDPVTGSGLRFFGSFVDAYRSTTLRRLPGFEMSEPEFYSWWPLRVILALFILNMIIATVRRIEFTFPNLGVLTVHTGIVTIALGSLYYRGLKIEGDTLLLSGQPGPDGSANVGPIQDRFYDNMTTALWLNQNSGLWDQRPIQPPRYNDYGLNAAGPVPGAPAKDRPLNLPVVDSARPDRPVIDADLKFRVVGYASYATPVRTWVPVEPPPPGSAAKANPLRAIKVRATFPDRPEAREAFRFDLFPDSPTQRIGEAQGAIGIEWTRGMSDSRWRAITATLPRGTLHAILVEIPGAAGGEHGAETKYAVFPITTGGTVNFEGYEITAKQILPEPPFPIITAGYQGARSSVAILSITPPSDPASGQNPKPFERWVYHRFPEISQDMLEELNERGMPKRRDADPAIRITYIDASFLQVFFDEREDGTARAAIRLDSGEARLVENLKVGSVLEEVIPRQDPATQPRIDLVVDQWAAHAESLEFPRVVPEIDRDKSDVGTHAKAMLAVEISSTAAPWKKTVWLPFTRYHHVEMDKHREVTLPDGRQIRMCFGRLAHRFPDFYLQLTNFEMIAYDHRGSPRDYQSVVRVIPAHESAETMRFKPYEHVTKLNAPLQAPFIWSEERSYLANVWGTLVSRLNRNQFKLSQAGWDAEGWRRTQEMADRGELPRPFASFTILGVGNNPGIHIVALGSVLMSIGIPWAFYIKPLILKRRKQRIQKQLAEGTYQRPGSASPREPAVPVPQGAAP